ncbi:MAG: TfuA-related McrA-glycine thioamidation protein [Methanosarcinaceae archaeon]|nr:TfuA-related McrA-glycine thioamidation protein [Methanosarcinaceae archaeon]
METPKKNLKTIVFAGTSISHEDARKILDVTYRPPVIRCDVDKAAKNGYNLIGIIDGVFFDKSAVSHREIIKVLNSGVTVVGGCSMGALRASELDSYGMVGIGKIYEWYRDGVIEADDEVAVTTNPDTFEAVSKPLVNIRETLNAAFNAGIIDDRTRKSFLQIAKKTYYPQRSYLGIIKKGIIDGVLSSEKGEELLGFCKDREVDVKRSDAILVLKAIKKLLEE